MAVKIYINGNTIVWPHAAIGYNDVAKLSGQVLPEVVYSRLDGEDGELRQGQTVAADKEMHFTSAEPETE